VIDLQSEILDMFRRPNRFSLSRLRHRNLLRTIRKEDDKTVIPVTIQVLPQPSATILADVGGNDTNAAHGTKARRDRYSAVFEERVVVG